MRYTIKFEGLDCPNCASKLEKHLKKIKGIKSLTVGFIASKIVFECEDYDVERIKNEIKMITEEREKEVRFI